MLDAFSIDLLGPPSVSFVEIYTVAICPNIVCLHVYTACLYHLGRLAVVSLVFLRQYKVYVYIMPSAYMPIAIYMEHT